MTKKEIENRIKEIDLILERIYKNPNLVNDVSLRSIQEHEEERLKLLKKLKNAK